MTYSKPGIRNNQVLVYATTQEVADAVAKYDSHREFVILKFQAAGFAVIKPQDLRYYYQPKHVVIEGIKGESILSL